MHIDFLMTEYIEERHLFDVIKLGLFVIVDGILA